MQLRDPKQMAVTYKPVKLCNTSLLNSVHAHHYTDGVLGQRSSSSKDFFRHKISSELFDLVVSKSSPTAESKH